MANRRVHKLEENPHFLAYEASPCGIYFVRVATIRITNSFSRGSLNNTSSILQFDSVSADGLKIIARAFRIGCGDSWGLEVSF